MEHKEIEGYSVFIMSQLLMDATNIFEGSTYDQIWTASNIHFRIFEKSEWFKGGDNEFHEMFNYIENDLK